MAPLKPAPPTTPGDVVDAHVHLFTVRILEEMVAAFPETSRLRKALKSRKWGRRGENLDVPDMAPEEMAAWYALRIKDAGVAKALVVSVMPDSTYVREFMVAAKGHVHALCNVDPRDVGAPALLERELAAGFKGVKLLPVNHRYHLSDEACRPFFKRASELGAPMIVHYGITVDPRGDLRYADPIELSPVARDFPEIRFVIAHFGAGYLDSALKLCYQCPNVSFDSSGTNNWMDFCMPKMTLPEVFDRVLSAIGPERVMFGTDAGTTAPYRKWIKFQQTRVLEELGLSATDRDCILRANAVRVFHLDD